MMEICVNRVSPIFGHAQYLIKALCGYLNLICNYYPPVLPNIQATKEQTLMLKLSILQNQKHPTEITECWIHDFGKSLLTKCKVRASYEFIYRHTGQTTETQPSLARLGEYHRKVYKSMIWWYWPPGLTNWIQFSADSDSDQKWESATVTSNAGKSGRLIPFQLNVLRTVHLTPIPVLMIGLTWLVAW